MSDGFPLNVVNKIGAALSPYFADYGDFLERGLRVNDPARCISIVPLAWNPDEGSYEIGQEESAIQKYTFRLQLMVKHNDPQEMMRIGVRDSKILRTVLYRSPALRVGLRDLTEDALGYRERFMRSKVQDQQFLRNELNGNNLFMSVTRYWIETEVTQIIT